MGGLKPGWSDNEDLPSVSDADLAGAGKRALERLAESCESLRQAAAAETGRQLARSPAPCFCVLLRLVPTSAFLVPMLRFDAVPSCLCGCSTTRRKFRRRIQAASARGRVGRRPGAVGGFWFNDQAEPKCQTTAA